MGAKLDRLGTELDRARRKQKEWENRVKELESRYREAENTEIHDLVHAAKLTPDQLADLLQRYAADKVPKPEELNRYGERSYEGGGETW